MAEYQVTQWRDLLSLVVARDPDSPDDLVKVMLAGRCQEAIDEAAMRLGEVDAEAYLNGWTRTPWAPEQGSPADVAARISAELEAQWDDSALRAYLDRLH